MSSVGPGLSIDARRHFLHALRRVLRPIIRLLIRSGISYDQFADVARGAYVESAVRDGIAASPKPTREQIALITGIPRQRVDHYIDDEGALPTAKSTLTDGMTEVLHKWHTDPQYLGPDSVPLELEYEAPSGPSFQRLVAEINAEVNPALVLEELLRAGSVARSESMRIRALTRHFIWLGGGPASIEYFGITLADLAHTLEYNFNPANASHKRLERFVSADKGLARSSISSFEAYAKDRTSQFLTDLDDWLARHSDANASQPGPRADTGLNVFLYLEPPSDDEPLSALVRRPRHDGSRAS